MPKVSIDDIVMLEKEVRFERAKPGALLEEEICFVLVTDKMVRANGLMANECYYLNGNKKAYLYKEQDTTAHIDGVPVVYPWQYRLRNNVHFRRFIDSVDKENMVERKELLELERNINGDMQKRGTKFVEDSRSK